MKPNPIGNTLFAVFFVVYCINLIPYALASMLLHFIGSNRLGAFWYNQDRTIASGIWSTTQETISSEVGRIAIGTGQPDGWTPKWGSETRLAKALANWLNNTPSLWGTSHTLKAVQHADALDRADDGREQ